MPRLSWWTGRWRRANGQPPSRAYPRPRHYERALAIEPRHRSAHEYIGEAYLMIGDEKNAQRHLAALRDICLLGCEELKDLEEAFVKYRGSSPPKR